MTRTGALLLVTMILMSWPAVSQDTDLPDFELAEEAVRRGDILPLATILERVAAVQPGRVIEVELEMEDNIPVYEVELISGDGRLLEVDIHARTGDILSLAEDD